MIKMLIHRSHRVLKASGHGFAHIWGLTINQITELPLVLRYKLEHDVRDYESIYYMVFETEAEAALFKLEYM